jgi:chromosome segregation protein
MRVKRLDVFGFKSFATKTTVHFEPGVTAIVGPNGSGKCVHGSSRVVLADGRVVRIDELVESAFQQSTCVERWDDGYCTYAHPQDLHVLSLNPHTLQIEPRRITAFIKREAPATLYRVMTKSGREIIATGYHPLFTLERGALKTLRADELKPGVRVAVPRRLPVSGTSDRFDVVGVLRQFERSDRVYVPHSEDLERWIDGVAARAGTLAAAAETAGVEIGHVRTVRVGQALNVATVSRVHDVFNEWVVEPWLGETLASRAGKSVTIPAEMTPSLARFLAYCISEGRITSANQVWFVNSDPALVQDFCDCVQETFNLEARVFSYTSSAKDVIVFSKTLCQYLGEAFGLATDQPSRKKRVPSAIFRASDETVAAFLSALFEGDGYCHLKSHPRTGRRIGYVEYATASRQLAEDVCFLLLRFGVFSRIVPHWKAATNTVRKTRRQYFSVFVYGGQQLARLAEVLRFRGVKHQTLQAFMDIQSVPNPNDDVVPGATSLVREAVRASGVAVKRIRAVFPTLAAYVEERCEATRPGLERVLDAIERFGQPSETAGRVCDRLRLLARSDVYWDEIVSVEQQPAPAWVYDLAIDGHHNFIANGMVVHNSNIVDSIRWVLGEHNPRDVRAPRLEDVIFNGTDLKAPLSMAEVSLTIDNEQGLLPIAFTEVTITRRVYRSGESEYLINQSPCRLKDIQELFLGTGLGGGTYAIIEQGHIDMILSSKPEERRVVFEEASGIAKYLSKKQETIRRLDETEEHLVRIADIIGEVRRQVGALERAANKARQYKAQWEQLKQLELRLVVDELSAGETRSKVLEDALASLTARRDELNAEKQSRMASLEACNAAVSAIQQQLQELRTKAVEAASQIEQHQSQQALKARWIEELSRQAQQLELEEQQLRVRLGGFDEQFARLSGGESELSVQLSGARAQLGEGGGELAAIEAALQRSLALIAEAKGQLFEAAAEASHQRNQLTEAASRLQAVEARLARLDEQEAHGAARAEDVRRRRDTLEQERSVLTRQTEDVQGRFTTTQQTLEAAGARRHELTGRLHQLRDQLAHLRAEEALAENLWRRYEGFPDTVKTLMGAAIDGLIGPLVDLIQAAPGHDAVVEAALGPLAEALVVQDRQALARCRQLLGAQRLESCRFIVLDDCPGSPALEPAAVQEGVAGAVKTYVRAEPRYQPLVDWLLNDSWVVDDLERLLGGRDVPQGRLVSRGGDRWDRRSWRFGIRGAASHSRLGRKQRWEQAQQRLRTLEEEFQRLDAEAKETEQRWQSLLAEQESAKGQLAHLNPALHKLESQLAQLSHELQRFEEESRTRALEAQELRASQEELRSAIRAVQQSAAQAQERQEAIERSLAESQRVRETTEQRRQELLIARAQIDATVQSLTERLQALQARRSELESDRVQLTAQVDARVGQRQEAVARSSDLAQQLEAHQQSAVQFQDERVRMEAELERVGRSLREEEGRRDQVLPRVLEAEQQLAALQRQIQEQTQQLSERMFRRSHLVERLRELYQIDEAAVHTELQAAPPPLSDEQRSGMSDQVQKLRAKLEGIGPVSLGSVEEYDELKRRLEFLQTQQQDLVQARDDLKTSITQINRTARTQFRETFERIKQEFQHYYTRLFTGGEANLILMDEDDVLECGIDIVARPPGKRLQSISLLSGGERALTAVALLFALFKVRPSPFCILDEIDAPLDEANVDRFTRVLEEFLALSQFILITHNKKTITKADSLYGVTMEEPGISKILSAKLKQAEGAAAPAPAPVPA